MNKNILKLFIFTLLLVSSCGQSKAENVVVLKATPALATEVTYMPDSVRRLITDDIVAALSAVGNNTTDVNSVRPLIKPPNISSYERLFDLYDQRFYMDKESCLRVANKAKADKLVLLVGGFDIKSPLLQRTWWSKLSIAGHNKPKQLYKLALSASVIDLKANKVTWESTFSKNFEINTYSVVPGGFSLQNLKQLEIRNFSRQIATAIKGSGFTALQLPAALPADSSVKNLNLTDESQPKDGHPIINTVDSNPSYETEDDVTKLKINDYKNWIKNRF